MKMYSASKREYDKVILDANNLAKLYSIEPGKYEIQIVSEGQYKITPMQNCKKKSIENVEKFIDMLSYAAHGYTDCEIPIKKYTELMSNFSNPITGEKMIDFKFKPKL